MKIAVAATRADENAEVSPRPGRSKFYLIFDESGHLLEVMANPFYRGGGGAGFGVAKMLQDKEVDIVVGGRFGENMEGALRGRGLRYRAMGGPVKEAMIQVLRSRTGQNEI